MDLSNLDERNKKELLHLTLSHRKLHDELNRAYINQFKNDHAIRNLHHLLVESEADTTTLIQLKVPKPTETEIKEELEREKSLVQGVE